MLSGIRAPFGKPNGWRDPVKMYRKGLPVGDNASFRKQEVTSYSIPRLESPAFYHGREIEATQNHGWSTLRDLLQR